MNWVLGLIGAILGIAISEERWLLGAVTGFIVLYCIGAFSQLRRRLSVLERELNVVRARVVAQAAPAEPVAGVETAAPPPAPVAETSPPPEPTPAIAIPDIAPAMASEETIAPSAGAEPPPLPETAEPSPIAQRPFAPVTRKPDVFDKAIARIKAWFTEGNVPVKVGVLVLFVGVAAALRYAVAQGYFHMPIEVRLALIATGGVVALAFGWRERERRPAFGLSLQGGALGVLLMTVFAAYRMYGLLPPTATFALVVVLVAGAALLAVLQDAIALAALGFVGGYLAPVLISTGSNNPVGLFSYYAALNAAVFGVSWKRNWRLLNLIGFAFTFGVGTAWGVKFYRPELFASVEPFLALFFVFYVAIGLLYVLRQTTHRRPWVDGTLVFGTPLLAFPLQAGLLKDDRMMLALSALVVAFVYAGLVYWLRRKRDERLLTEAYGALALGFATLAVPLAFSAGTTASVWALEGAGIAWLGIRQNRNFPWLCGLGLQMLAAGSYVIAQVNFNPYTTPMLLLNPAWLGAALIGFAGFALSLIHDRRRPIALLPAVLFTWATAWWLIAALTQLDLARTLGYGQWRFAMGYFAGTIAIAALLRARLPWPRLGWLIAVCAFAGFWMSFAFHPDVGGPLAPDRLVVWTAYALAIGYALWSARAESARIPAATHLLWLWTIAATTSMQSRHLAVAQQLANGWEYAALLAPLALLTFGLRSRPSAFAWPRTALFGGYRVGWFAPAAVLLGFAFVAGLFVEGGSAPLAYLPVFNPLELAMIAIGALLYAMCDGSLQALRKIWSYAGFAFATSATLRAVHHWHGDPWSEDVFNSAMSEMALSLVWSLLGVGSWILGSRRGDRRLWMGGAVLMGVVLLKLAIVDRTYMGNMPGIVSFLAVGLLLVGVGYIAPSPPKRVENTGATKDEGVEST